MNLHAGGCLCGAIRFQTVGDPLRVTICHCRFCQRATGSAYMVEPVFEAEHVQVTAGSPSTYQTTSEGSGKVVRVHFCAACGTKLYLSFERFPNTLGVYAGAFDDPQWFEIRTENSKHIFLDVARPDTIIPAGVNSYREHAITNDGSPCEPVVYHEPQVVGRTAADLSNTGAAS